MSRTEKTVYTDDSSLFEKGKKKIARIPITKTLSGEQLNITAHTVAGILPGKTLCIFGSVHGDEAGTINLFRKLSEVLEPENLNGSVIMLPVANPLGLQAFSRVSPEMHGRNDLHAEFPGSDKGSLTQLIALKISENILSESDVLIDIHSGGFGGRLQNRVDFTAGLDNQLRNEVLELCRAFGSFLINEKDMNGSATAWMNACGKPAIHIESGGAYLGKTDTAEALSQVYDGILNMASVLGIIKTEIIIRNKEQMLFHGKERFEVGSKTGGYLESCLASYADLEKPVSKGQVLGNIYDPYTLKLSEKLISPVDGYLFFSRYSGVIEAGSKVFGIAAKNGSEWL